MDPHAPRRILNELVSEKNALDATSKLKVAVGFHVLGFPFSASEALPESAKGHYPILTAFLNVQAGNYVDGLKESEVAVS